MKNKKQVFWVAVSSFIVLAVLYVVTTYDFSGGSLEKKSTVLFEHLPASASVYIDGKPTALIRPSDNQQSVTLSPGPHSIVVSRDDNWPWMTVIDAKSGEKIRLSPFMFSKSIPVKEYPTSSKNYSLLRSAISTSKIPIAVSKQTDEDILESRERILLTSRTNKSRTLAVWIEEGAVVVQKMDSSKCEKIESESCWSPQVVLTPVNKIVNVFPYMERNDFVIVALDNGVYAVETSLSGEFRNFQVLYDDVVVGAAIYEGNILVLGSNNSIYELPLAL